jgi:hypothetical protein
LLSAAPAFLASDCTLFTAPCIPLDFLALMTSPCFVGMV